MRREVIAGMHDKPKKKRRKVGTGTGSASADDKNGMPCTNIVSTEQTMTVPRYLSIHNPESTSANISTAGTDLTGDLVNQPENQPGCFQDQASSLSTPVTPVTNKGSTSANISTAGTGLTGDFVNQPENQPGCSKGQASSLSTPVAPVTNKQTSCCSHKSELYTRNRCNKRLKSKVNELRDTVRELRKVSSKSHTNSTLSWDYKSTMRLNIKILILIFCLNRKYKILRKMKMLVNWDPVAVRVTQMMNRNKLKNMTIIMFGPVVGMNQVERAVNQGKKLTTLNQRMVTLIVTMMMMMMAVIVIQMLILMLK